MNSLDTSLGFLLQQHKKQDFQEPGKCQMHKDLSLTEGNNLQKIMVSEIFLDLPTVLLQMNLVLLNWVKMCRFALLATYGS